MSQTIGTPAKNYTDGTDSDYHALGEMTFRMKSASADGTSSIIPVTNPSTSTNNLTASSPPTASNGSPGYTSGSRWYDTTAGRGYIRMNPTAGAAVWAPIEPVLHPRVVVAIAILDSKSRRIMPNVATSLAAMGTVLPDALSGTPIAQTWGNSSYLTQPGIPQAATSQIRIYQRYFYLNNP